jgi:hypothetical protein
LQLQCQCASNMAWRCLVPSISAAQDGRKCLRTGLPLNGVTPREDAQPANANLSLHAVVLGCRGRSLLLQLCHKHRCQHPEGAPGWFEAATRLWWLFVLCSVVGDSDVAARVLRPACTREFCAAYALSARQDRWHWQECWCLRPFKGDPANLNRSRADCLICHASLREGNGTCTCINQACVRGMAHAQALINIGAIVPAQPGKGLWWRARKCS